MADGLHWVGAGVDDGEHGGDDPEEEAGHHAAEEGNDEDDNDDSIHVGDLPDGGNVELIHHDVPLIVHDPLRAWHTRHNHSNTLSAWLILLNC